MQISGSDILSNLGLIPKPQPAGPRPQAKEPPAQGPQAGPPAQDRTPAQAAGSGPERIQQAARAGSPGESAGVAQAQNLEQAVQTLSDQGRLPPRGSLVDLRA